MWYILHCENDYIQNQLRCFKKALGSAYTVFAPAVKDLRKKVRRSVRVLPLIHEYIFIKGESSTRIEEEAKNHFVSSYLLTDPSGKPTQISTEVLCQLTEGAKQDSGPRKNDAYIQANIGKYLTILSYPYKGYIGRIINGDAYNLSVLTFYKDRLIILPIDIRMQEYKLHD